MIVVDHGWKPSRISRTLRCFRVLKRIRVTNPRVAKLGEGDRLVGCQEVFWCAVFQAVGVSSATRVMGQSPSLGNTSLR